LWTASNYSPSTPQDQRLEQYAWIVQTSNGYTFQSMGIPPSPCGVTEPIQVEKPAGAIAFIHTHPWSVLEVQTSCGSDNGTYYGLPSPQDVSTSATLGIPGYILDANGITKFDAATGSGTGTSIDARIPRCGY
jgi:hypothetical protein